MSFRVIALTAAIVFVLAGLALAGPFVVVSDSKVLQAPQADSKSIDEVPAGNIVEVTHQAGDYMRVEYGLSGKTGYLPAESLQQAKTRGGPLVPILIAAATPLGKMVAKKATEWFKKKFNIDLGGKSEEASGKFDPGREMTAVGKEGGWLKVILPGGAIGYVREAANLLPMQDISYAPSSTMGIWKNSDAIPGEASALAMQVEVRKTDGTPVPSDSTLRLGDEYRIYITASADCYVRVTLETPGENHVCQYYPNHFPGTQTSIVFKAGKTYSGEMLPQGKNFKVAKPIGEKDILRIEATSAAPYHYVTQGDGCAPTEKFRGGGFSRAGDVNNPTAQVLIEYPINTIE
jgi:hypothetical protein